MPSFLRFFFSLVLAVLLISCAPSASPEYSARDEPAVLPSLPPSATPEAFPATPIFPPVPSATPTPLVPQLPAGERGNLSLRLPGEVPIREYSGVIPSFKTSAQARIYAEQAVREGRYAQAALAFRREAAFYRARGLTDAAIIQERKATRYETDVRLFLERQPTSGELRRLYTAARLEPQSGAYLGAFIDRDDALPRTFYGENFQTHRYPRDFENAVGRGHASYFMYVAYGQAFPMRWAQTLKEAGVIPHIAWEPKNLNAVRDDFYMRRFAQRCAQLKWPVFIRFAGEMNGFWTPYHRNPKLYREKFRLVHQIIRRAAPMAATIWCVNSVPSDNIRAYYPGDDGCDWVGINLYAVPFYDNNRRRPAFADNPLALIEPIYREYSARKPIALCEFAASHFAAADRRAHLDFALQKTALVYSALPRLYPRIKLVNWFSMNTLRHARAGRQINNYQLTARPELARLYRGFTEENFYLKRPRVLGAPVSLPMPLSASTIIRGAGKISIWAKTYTPRPKVFVQLNGAIIYASDELGAHILTLDSHTLSEGRKTLAVFVFDEKNRFIARRSAMVTLKSVTTKLIAGRKHSETRAQAVGGRVQRLVRPVLGRYRPVKLPCNL